jgi:hypothetical protein
LNNSKYVETWREDERRRHFEPKTEKLEKIVPLLSAELHNDSAKVLSKYSYYYSLLRLVDSIRLDTPPTRIFYPYDRSFHVYISILAQEQHHDC